MKSRIKKRAFGIATLALVLILALTAALYSAAFFSPATYANTYHSVSISGANNVDVYISGDGVTQDDNGNYQIPHGADVEITVVNDNSVSTSLSIITGDTSETSDSNFAKVTNVTDNLSITVATEEGFATEPGSSLSTAYEINDGDYLISLSKILAARTDGSDITATTAATFAGYLADFGLDKEEWYTVTDGETVFNATEANIAAVKTVLLAAQTKLSTSYFSLSDDVMINDSTSAEDPTDYSHGYFGLGSRRGVPFGGVFDFNGHSATLHLSIAEADERNFSPTEPATGSSGTDNVLSIGFFNYIYGDGSNACAILGADVRGTIAVSADVPSTADDSGQYRVYIGGVAGSIGDKVVLSNVKSSVSVSAQTGFSDIVYDDSGNGQNADNINTGVSVYAGGVFGFSGADVDEWSNVSYDGIYSEISVVCAGADTDERVIVGAFAGVIQNAYVRNFSANLRGANILADASDNGSAIAGGLAGAVYSATNRYGELDSVGDYTIGGININAAGSTVSASVAAKEQNSNLDADDIYNTDNNEANFSVAISGGLFGVAYAEQSQNTSQSTSTSGSLTIGDLDFTSQSSDGVFSVEAYTSDTSSYGIPFAGGVIGYVVDSDNDSITFSPDTGSSSGDGGVFVFESNVVVTSTQNGNGPVYAGGVFGYNAFDISGVKDAHAQFNLNDEAHSVTVVAEQSQSSGSDSTSTLYDVSAGLVTSKLPAGYSFSYVDFTAHGSTVTARRETGSSAVGDISAGSIAGKAVGDSSSFISNVEVTLNNCSINALGNSFDSNNEDELNNNVYAGGIIGYVANYGRNYQNDATYGLEYITLELSVNDPSFYAVRAVQNATTEKININDNLPDDYKSEGYAGGMFGMLHYSAARNLTIEGKGQDKPLIYFHGSNDPQTSCIGGIAGALRNEGTVGCAVVQSSVKNIHVTGTAYVETNSSDRYDIYVGGAIGVVGSTNANAYHNVDSVTVEDTAIEAVGERDMLTYGGGIIGGAWWQSNFALENCISRNNTVVASSVTFRTYAGGIAGMIQKNADSPSSGSAENYISSAKVFNTSVEAVTYSEQGHYAFAAGICPRIEQRAYISDSVSNAVVSAFGTNPVLAGIGIFDAGSYAATNQSASRNNYFVAANVQESSMAEAYAFRYTSGNVYSATGQGNYAAALIGASENVVNSDNGSNRYTISNQSGSVAVYENTGLNLSNASVNNNTVNCSDTSGNQIQIVLAGGDYANLGISDGALHVTGNNKGAGAVYVQIRILTSDGDYDLLCSYPVVIQDYSYSGGVSIYDNDNPSDLVSADNSRNYLSQVVNTYNSVDFSQLETYYINNSVYPIQGSIFTIVGTQNDDTDDMVSIREDGYLYFRNSMSIEEGIPTNPPDNNERVPNAIKFTVGGAGVITFTARLNNDSAFAEGKELLFNLYRYTDSGYESEASDVNFISAGDSYNTYQISVSNAGTYYLGSTRGGYRVYTVSFSYNNTSDDPNSTAETFAGSVYFQIFAGETSYVQNVLLKSENIYSPQIFMVDSPLVGFGGFNEDGSLVNTVTAEAVNNIIDSVIGTSLTPSAVLDFFNIRLSADGDYVTVSPILGKSEGRALILRYNTGSGIFHVIIEVVPNAIEGITVTPSEDTPPYATHEVEVEGGKETHHIYSAGDTVLLESEVEYRFDYNRFIVDVEYELGVVYDENGNQSTSLRNFITVQPNGTVLIDDDVPSGTRFTVICYDVNDENNKAKQGTIILEVRTDIDVESRDLTGANYAPVADNHAIIGEEFSFTVSPRPGYGLNPKVTLDLYNGSTRIGTITLTFKEERAGSPGTPKISVYDVENDSYTLATTYKITYNYDAQTGRYTITLGANVTQIVGLNKIYIDAEFQKVYTIMFDLGTWADDDGGLRYYTYTVKNGTDINSKLYNSIVKTIATENEGSENRINERAGFTFKGFYLTSIASSESAYQQSFEDRFNVETATEQVRGSINYYARWNYTVVLNAPESVGIESGLADSLVSNEESGGGVIPIDTMHGFSFGLTGNYVGSPRVEVYTVAAINGENILNPLAFEESDGIYTVTDPDDITGTIYIYVYPDNIAVGVGETDTGSSFSTDIDLREDGIFTVRYVINHGVGDTTLGNSAVFNFSDNLPVGTRIRLFYQQDSTPVAVGEYVVDGENGVSSVKASDFGALPGSGTIPDGGTAGIGSETYYLVITLPNNKDNFTNTNGAVNFTVSVAARDITGLTKTEYETTAHIIPDEKRETGEPQSKIQDATLGESQNETLSATVNMYGAIIREGSLLDGIISFDSSDTANGEEGAPADVRHQSKFYVWRIAIDDDWGTDVKISGTASGSVVTTDDYVYVLADNKLTVSGDYTVELMEVTNTQYPAAGVVIWRSGSGN